MNIKDIWLTLSSCLFQTCSGYNTRVRKTSQDAVEFLFYTCLPLLT
ncbi:MAG: hypothetical protein QNJ70_15875 [Xenococcaceae cyanobacterium MO_207.B15]|nr:hypothetical protein [Xenococcaceae cyanobacterium MO_207.B15]MDJ0742645.1 hypothetical protein [Xenococcaceae cyanobacterium MO_167.B27]